jgi:sulfate transport system permease protein
MAVRRRGVLPGFGLSLGYTLFYLSALVLLPLAALVLHASDLGALELYRLIAEPRTLAAIGLTFGASFLAALVDAIVGLLVAWVLVRYSFPGRSVLDTLVDLPFALPTAVAGIALTAIYAKNGWLGGTLAKAGIEVAFTRTGIVIALAFIGLPFVVRTVQPVLESLDSELEDAAEVLGASAMQTFWRVLLPPLIPPLLTGFALSFARALGEYGSVVFISGNLPMKTEITPLLIVIKLEQYDYNGAAALGFIMLVMSFVMLFAINLVQTWGRRRQVASGR